MTPEEIEALEKAVVDLRHERDQARFALELMTSDRDQLYAQLLEIRNATGPIAKNHWYAYKIPATSTTPALTGALDMLEVSRWEGVQKRKDGPWSYQIYFRGSNLFPVFPQAEFNKFAPVFDAYISRE